MEARQERGLQIAALTPIKQSKLGYIVPSQSGNGTYVVSLDGSEPYCTCPDFEFRRVSCKHIYAVQYTIQREANADGTVTETVRETVTETKEVKVTYSQNWSVYNDAQTHEQEEFLRLLRALCDTVQQPTQTMGRPRLPLSDVIFGATYKVYSTMSGRRFMTDLREAQSKGLVDKAPSFTSTFRCLENAELTPILKGLIELSASPLKSVETDFAVDSSGFATSVYSRWFDHKYGKMRSEAKWIKTHLMCGVKTHIVTSVDAMDWESPDNRQLPGLVAKTAENFTINEVSADKAYSDRRNLHAVDNLGGTAYIPFKVSSTGMGGTRRKYDGLWHYMWAYYNFNKQAFLGHYHKRSNVETTFSMIKAKFGGAVRSKTPVAQVNEVLAKVLCHNLCVLIQSWRELGIEADFTNPTCSQSQPPVPKLAWN